MFLNEQNYYLESKHFSASDIVIDSATEDVHGVGDRRGGMEQTSGRHVTLQGRLYDTPGLCVQVITVQVIGQGAISCATEDVEVAIIGDHGVAVTTCRRGRSPTQDVLR